MCDMSYVIDMSGTYLGYTKYKQHTTETVHPLDKAWRVWKTRSASIRYDEVTCTSTSFLSPSQLWSSLSTHNPRRPATVPTRYPAVKIHLSLSVLATSCKWTECRQAGNRGTSSMDTTYWNIYRPWPWRPQRRPCTANPCNLCIDTAGTEM